MGPVRRLWIHNNPSCQNIYLLTSKKSRAEQKGSLSSKLYCTKSLYTEKNINASIYNHEVIYLVKILWNWSRSEELSLSSLFKNSLTITSISVSWSLIKIFVLLYLYKQRRTAKMRKGILHLEIVIFNSLRINWAWLITEASFCAWTEWKLENRCLEHMS